MIISRVSLFLGLIKLRELVKLPKIRNMEVNLRRADPDSYRQILSEMKSKEIQNLIVDTKPEHMHHFLQMVNLSYCPNYRHIRKYNINSGKTYINSTRYKSAKAEDD